MTTSPARVIHADCLTALRDLPDASVDAVVTDPPYGLSNTTAVQVTETITRWVSGEREYLPSARGFMGHEWDGFVPPPAVWDECLRVLKPGGHLIAFAGSRTQDLMGLAVRLAGFEIRDSVAWLYGSGFPKSMDVSKAIDKARTEDVAPLRVVCRAVRAAMDSRGIRSADLVAHFDNCHPRLIDHWAARDTDSQPALPTPSQWTVLVGLFPELSEHTPEADRLNARKGRLGDDYLARPVTGAHSAGLTRGVAGVGGARVAGGTITTPTTAAAREWEGWGTALKPAHEPIILARKPLDGTVAANVLEHGTGALNIDGSRIGGPSGRWPANVVLDESQAAELDRQSGVSVSRIGRPRGAASGDGWGMTKTGAEYADEGGASRFFYVPKAPKSERPVVDGTAHPTVKPLALMRWLVRMVTPPGGVVLDPFAGSGTTMEAAMLEGFNVIGVEREADYLPLIRARIARAVEVQERTAEAAAGYLFDLDDARRP